MRSNNKTTPLLHKLCSFYELKAFANKEQSQNAPSKRKKENREPIGQITIW
jgi:hypothetical protein